MLYNLEPSTELSGGAWYTDNELDEEFINTMLNIVEAFIKRAVSGRSSFLKARFSILCPMIDRSLDSRHPIITYHCNLSSPLPVFTVRIQFQFEWPPSNFFSSKPTKRSSDLNLHQEFQNFRHSVISG